MVIEFLLIFVVLAIMFFILSVLLMDDYPEITIPLIMVGIIFTILCTYGMWDVEYAYIGFNNTIGNTTFYRESVSYGDPYSYIFIGLFFMYILLFFRTGHNLWKNALETKGQMDYRFSSNRFNKR